MRAALSSTARVPSLLVPFSLRVRDSDARTHERQPALHRMAADGGSAPSSVPTLPCSFSPTSRHYLAVCAQDGRLRIWNADSRALHREYVPSAHLSATCTCIAWGPCRATKVHTGRGASPSAPRSLTRAHFVRHDTATPQAPRAHSLAS